MGIADLKEDYNLEEWTIYSILKDMESRVEAKMIGIFLIVLIKTGSVYFRQKYFFLHKINLMLLKSSSAPY